MAGNNILDTEPKRKKLNPRPEPYWQKTSKGRFVGFRKLDSGGTWIARLGKKQKRLGNEIEFTYTEALAAANEWYDQVDLVGPVRYTVKRAVDDYAKHLHLSRSPKASWHVEQRLLKHLPDALLDTELSDLRAKNVKAWHETLVRISDDPERVRKSKASANRILAHFKAACNLAFRNQRVASDQAWKVVSVFSNAEKARDLSLTDEQVQRLLDHIDGAFHDLVEAAVITGARYGELRAANVEDFDPIQGTVKFDGKTGPRACFLRGSKYAFAKQNIDGCFQHSAEVAEDQA